MNDIIIKSCNLILNEQIKISHNIKKYVKYAKNMDSLFIDAVKIGNIKNIKYLIQNGSDIHFDNDNALMISVQMRNYEIVKYLIENGSDIHTKMVKH